MGTKQIYRSVAFFNQIVYFFNHIKMIIHIVHIQIFVYAVFVWKRERFFGNIVFFGGIKYAVCISIILFFQNNKTLFLQYKVCDFFSQKNSVFKIETICPFVFKHGQKIRECKNMTFSFFEKLAYMFNEL